MDASLEIQKELLKAKKYAGVESPAYFNDLNRLESGEPFEYVLGYTDFLECHIDLRLHPMIPRFETAFWVKQAIDELRNHRRALVLADAFAGSGNVSVALLKHIQDAHVDIGELDSALLPQIKTNCELNGIEETRYKIFASNALESFGNEYDAIFAVPPYVAHSALPDLDPEMINFEPHLAFFADNDGSAFHSELITTAYDKLKEGGTLFMEADMGQEEKIQKMVQGTRWRKLEFWPDPYSAAPNVVLRK